VADPIFAAPPGVDGWREVEVPIESIDFAAGQLLGFGDMIEVLVPQALRDELGRRAAAVASLYGAPDKRPSRSDRAPVSI
jgi:predicted DNA-binding transcriptional regulator YafY